MTTATGWSFSAGTWDENRVRAFEAASGIIFVEYREKDEGSGKAKRIRQSLGHRDRRKAVRQVKEIAAKLAEVSGLPREITLRSLFDIYVREVTPRKGVNKQHHDRRCSAMFLRFFGADRLPSTLSLRDWEGFIDARRVGRIGPGEDSRPVRDRQVEYDLCWIRAVFHWATKAGRDGQPLVARNPFAGYSMPRERSPIRTTLTDEQYQAIHRVAGTIDWRLELALVLANETGHRISAIRHLRWSDVDLETGRIRWRSEHDKIGFEHATPIGDGLADILQAARSKSMGIGDAWILPSSRRADIPCPKGTLDKWFDEAVDLAGLKLPARTGWHSLRRKFATELKDLPLRDLCYLGGWKNPTTLLTCYQQPDEDVMRQALVGRRAFRGTQVVGSNSHQIATK